MKRSILRFGLLFGLVACAAPATTSGGQPAARGSAGPFLSQRLAIADRTPTGFTVEVQLVMDNPGPGTLLVRTADYTATIGDDSKFKGDLVLDQTAEAGERQGVVVPIKIDLKARAAELGAGNVTVRVVGALHVSHRGDADLHYDVSLDVPGQSLIAR